MAWNTNSSLGSGSSFGKSNKGRGKTRSREQERAQEDEERVFQRVQPHPEVTPIQESDVADTQDLAEYFADCVHASLGEHWTAGWWVKEWFAERAQWVFVTFDPTDGGQYDIQSTPNLWARIITRFFDPTRRDPAVGKSGPALWNEFKHWAKNVDLIPERIIRSRAKEISGQTRMLQAAAEMFALDIDLLVERERECRKVVEDLKEARIENRASRKPQHDDRDLRSALSDAEDELWECYEDQRENVEAATGGTVPDLIQRWRERRALVQRAGDDVTHAWREDYREENPLPKTSSERKDWTARMERSVERFQKSEEYRIAVEARLAELSVPKPGESGWVHPDPAEAELTDEDRERILAEPEDEDPDPGGLLAKEAMDQMIAESNARMVAALAETRKRIMGTSDEDEE